MALELERQALVALDLAARLDFLPPALGILAPRGVAVALQPDDVALHVALVLQGVAVERLAARAAIGARRRRRVVHAARLALLGLPALGLPAGAVPRSGGSHPPGAAPRSAGSRSGCAPVRGSARSRRRKPIRDDAGDGDHAIAGEQPGTPDLLGGQAAGFADHERLLVVARAQLGVGKHFVGLLEDLRVGHGAGGAQRRGALHVRFLDLLGGGVARDPEQVVERLGHGAIGSAAAATAARTARAGGLLHARGRGALPRSGPARRAAARRSSRAARRRSWAPWWSR